MNDGLYRALVHRQIPQACEGLLAVLPSYYERVGPRIVLTAPHLTATKHLFLGLRVGLFGKVKRNEVTYESPSVLLHSPELHCFAAHQIPLRMKLTLPQRRQLLEVEAEEILVHLEGDYEHERGWEKQEHGWLANIEFFFVTDLQYALHAVKLMRRFWH